MKAIGSSLPFLILLSGFMIMTGLISMRKEPPRVERSERAILVDVASVMACPEGFSLRTDGEVVPYREISQSAQVAGRIGHKSPVARAGNYVRKGDLLFEIDPRDYELEVRRQQESVQQAGTSVEELDVEEANVQQLVELAQEQLTLQRAELARFEDLRKQNAASTSQLERAQQSELESLNGLQTLKNQLALMKARRSRLLQQKQSAITSMEIAALNLERTKVVSPIEGVVIQDFAEQDDFVQPGSQLIQLEDRSKVEVRFSLRVDQMRWLWNSEGRLSDAAEPALANRAYAYELPKIRLTIRVHADGHEFTWPARLDRYDGAGIDPRTRTVPLIAVVDDPNHVSVQVDGNAPSLGIPPTLLRGSYVTVELPVGKNMPLVSIPANAYRPDKTVWIYRDGVLEIAPVNVAYSDDNVAIVLVDTSSVQPGDQVITSPLPVAEENMRVEIAGT